MVGNFVLWNLAVLSEQFACGIPVLGQILGPWTRLATLFACVSGRERSEDFCVFDHVVLLCGVSLVLSEFLEDILQVLYPRMLTLLIVCTDGEAPLQPGPARSPRFSE